MKKFIFFAAVAMTVSFASCNNSASKECKEAENAPAETVETVQEPVVLQEEVTEEVAVDSTATQAQ